MREYSVMIFDNTIAYFVDSKENTLEEMFNKKIKINTRVVTVVKGFSNGSKAKTFIKDFNNETLTEEEEEFLDMNETIYWESKVITPDLTPNNSWTNNTVAASSNSINEIDRIIYKSYMLTDDERSWLNSVADKNTEKDRVFSISFKKKC